MDKKRLEKLAYEAKNGNTDAFKDIYIIMYDNLFRMVYRTVKDEALAQDIIQDTFVSAIENIWTLKKPNMISSWLFSIAANKCKDVLKKKSPMLFSEFDEDQIENIADETSETTLDNSVESAELKDMINDILDTIPADNRLCLLMKYQEGLPVKSIAAALSISESTVKGRLLRARNQIISEVRIRRKKGTSLYGFSAWLVFIRLLRQSGRAGAISAAATASADSAFAGISAAAGTTASGTAAAGSAAASTAAVGTAAASTAAGTSAAATAATAAKIAVTTGFVQKAVIGIVGVAIATGSTAAVVTIAEESKKPDIKPAVVLSADEADQNYLNNADLSVDSDQNNSVENAQQPETTTEENSFKSFLDKVENVFDGNKDDPQDETESQSEKENRFSLFDLFTKKENNPSQEAEASTSGSSAAKQESTSATAKPTSASATTTMRSAATATAASAKSTTTTTAKKTTTTTTTKKTTTTTKKTTTTTKKATTAANATVVVTVKNEDGSTRKVNLSFKPGETISQDTVYDKLYDQYGIDALVVVTKTTAEAGKTYTATAY